MKKLLVILLAAVMMFSMISCDLFGKDNKDGENGDNSGDNSSNTGDSGDDLNKGEEIEGPIIDWP